MIVTIIQLCDNKPSIRFTIRVCEDRELRFLRPDRTYGDEAPEGLSIRLPLNISIIAQLCQQCNGGPFPQEGKLGA